MAMVEKTFTVVTQTWVDEASATIKIDYLRTWRELYYQIAAAGIGWTLEVTTDTLNGKNGGTFAGKMHHTATGLWYNCYSSSGNTSTTALAIYNAAGKLCGRYMALYLPLYNNTGANSQNTYYVDEINDGVFQDCRIAQGPSKCMWRVARGELIDGTIEGYSSSISGSSSADSSSSSSIITELRTYSDLVGEPQSVSFTATGIGGTVAYGNQLYIVRCYGIRTNQTNGITVTWGGKKTWRTSYTLVPKATYVIDNKRYTALSENVLLEE